MRYQSINRIKASELFEDLEQQIMDSNNLSNELDIQLREEILQASTNAKASLKSRSLRTYEYDYKFGLELYKLFKEHYSNILNIRNFSNNNFWMYLSLIIVPELVQERWGDNEARFYKQSNRIWLKTLWWYIHISWQDDFDKTKELIKDYTTDTIVQITERTGKGYDVELNREIFRVYSNYVDHPNKNILRSVMVLNTAYLENTEPRFFKNGIKGYVNMLFEQIVHN